MGFDLSVKNGALKSDSSGNMIMRNTVPDGDIDFYINDGGTDTLVLKLDGASAGLTIPGALTLSGAVTVSNVLNLSGTVDNAIDASGATITSLIKVADGQGAVVGSMTAKSPESDAEAGYIKIDIAGTAYEIPFYAVA